jgi:hypothetical protein
MLFLIHESFIRLDFGFIPHRMQIRRGNKARANTSQSTNFIEPQ